MKAELFNKHITQVEKNKTLFNDRNHDLRAPWFLSRWQLESLGENIIPFSADTSIVISSPQLVRLYFSRLPLQEKQSEYLVIMNWK